MRRVIPFLVAGLLAFSVGSAASLGIPSPVSAATLAATTTCANGVDDTGGLGVICEVTIVNTITPSGGSSVVTVRECHGAAGDPTAACTTNTQRLTQPVTAVTQCNATANGGGATLRCSVRVTNTYAVNPNPTAVTVNQCVGSGDGDTTGCNPRPASTTDATITQCDGSANGGTLVGLTCIASGTESGAMAVTVNQCNGSANGGGALVICSVQISNSLQAPGSSGSLAPSSPATVSLGGGPMLTQPPTDADPVSTPTVPDTSPVLPSLLIGLVAIFTLLTVQRLKVRR